MDRSTNIIKNINSESKGFIVVKKDKLRKLVKGMVPKDKQSIVNLAIRPFAVKGGILEIPDFIKARDTLKTILKEDCGPTEAQVKEKTYIEWRDDFIAEFNLCVKSVYSQDNPKASKTHSGYSVRFASFFHETGLQTGSALDVMASLAKYYQKINVTPPGIYGVSFKEIHSRLNTQGNQIDTVITQILFDGLVKKIYSDVMGKSAGNGIITKFLNKKKHPRKKKLLHCGKCKSTNRS